MNGSKESVVNSADCVGTEKQMAMNKIIITHSVVAGTDDHVAGCSDISECPEFGLAFFCVCVYMLVVRSTLLCEESTQQQWKVMRRKDMHPQVVEKEVQKVASHTFTQY